MIDEGHVKFAAEWIEEAASAPRQLEALSRWRRALHDAGLIGHYADIDIGYGNLSVRLAGDEFLITGTQTGHLRETDSRHYCRVTAFDIDTNQVCCRGPVMASSESMTHAAIYARDAAVGSVAHVHDETLWAWALDRLPSTRADVAYGTPAMAREFQRLVDDPEFAGIAVMAGHEGGLIATGADVAQAAGRLLDLKGSNGQ